MIYPKKCPFCGKIFSGGICEECRKKLPWIEEPICKRCGKPIQSEVKEYCYDCSRRKHYFNEGRALLVHKKPVTDVVYALKYKDKRIYGEILAKEMAKAYSGYMRARRADLIVPIPLHKSRRRKRGYNQAEILAGVISKETGIPYDKDVLFRVKKTVAQKEYGNRQRYKNIRGAFIAKKDMTGKNIFLIDDIYTTGSTLDEASKILTKAGALNVYFLVLSIGQGL